MNKIIKVKFLYPEKFHDFYANVILDHLKSFADVQLSDDPDYVFYSSNDDSVLNYNCIRISIGSENHRPDFNICDYAIGFDHLNFEDRYFRYPMYLFYRDLLDKIDIVKSSIEGDSPSLINRRFCNFIVSNGFADQIRTKFFKNLLKYKHVESAGKYLNNTGKSLSEEHRIEFQSGFKFSLCFENSSSPGYLTEKLFFAAASNTVPIYWGDPRVDLPLNGSGSGLNPDAIINVHRFSNFDEAIDYISDIDSSPNKYHKILNSDLFIDNNHVNLFNDGLNHFLLNIFDQELSNAFRRGFGQVRLRSERKRRLMTQKFNTDNFIGSLINRISRRFKR